MVLYFQMPHSLDFAKEVNHFTVFHLHQLCQLLQSHQDAAVQISKQQCWQDTLMRLYLRGDGSLRGADTVSTCSLDLNRISGIHTNRLELPLEKRKRAGSASRLDRLEDDRFSIGDTRSVDSLENGDVVSLVETPSSCASAEPPLHNKHCVVGISGGLTLDLSHLLAYEGGESGNQTPGSMPSTPSPLETSKPFPGSTTDRDANSSMADDSFLFSDNISLGESFNSGEVFFTLRTNVSNLSFIYSCNLFTNLPVNTIFYPTIYTAACACICVIHESVCPFTLLHMAPM